MPLGIHCRSEEKQFKDILMLDHLVPDELVWVVHKLLLYWEF